MISNIIQCDKSRITKQEIPKAHFPFHYNQMHYFIRTISSKGYHAQNIYPTIGDECRWSNRKRQILQGKRENPKDIRIHKQ